MKGIVKEWAKDFSKEMSIIQNKSTIHSIEMFIEDKSVCLQPLRSRLEAIQKLQPLPQ